MFFIKNQAYASAGVPCVDGPLISDTNLVLNNQTISDKRRFVATETITAGANYGVESTGCLSFSAATRISLEPGFSVKANTSIEI